MTETQHVDILVSLRNVEDDRTFEVTVPFTGTYVSGFAIAQEIEAITKEAIRVVLDREQDVALTLAASKGEIVPDTFRKAGETRRFAVDAEYAYRGGSYAADYQAVDEDCATLQALWDMATTNYDNGFGLGNIGLLDTYVAFMADSNVISAKPEPVSAAESDKAFVDLVLALRDGGDADTALARAQEVLQLRGLIETASPGLKP